MQQTFDNVVAYSHPGDNNSTQQQKEEEALINCSLLSKANEVVGTGAAMLEAVAQFNPDIPIKTFDTLWIKQKS